MLNFCGHSGVLIVSLFGKVQDRGLEITLSGIIGVSVSDSVTHPELGLFNVVLETAVDVGLIAPGNTGTVILLDGVGVGSMRTLSVVGSSGRIKIIFFQDISRAVSQTTETVIIGIRVNISLVFGGICIVRTSIVKERC